MLRCITLFVFLALGTFSLQLIAAPISLHQLDAAVARASSNLDSADPALESLQKNYRETRSFLLEVDRQKASMEAYAAARANAYNEAQEINSQLEKLLEQPEKPAPQSVPLVELEQIIQVDKSELAVLQNRLNEVNNQKTTETGRPAIIRNRLADLGSALPDLQANLKLLDASAESGSLDEARFWLAQSQLKANRAEKAALDEELLSQPMRLQLLDARQDKLTHDITLLENRILAMEQQSGELRQGEADEALAAANTAKEESLGKHSLVQELADHNAVISASLGERNSAIESLRQEELDSSAQAEQFERELDVIERKLEILGMNKTVGEILREQAVRLPAIKVTDKRLASIAELISQSSLRQMELRDKRRELSSVKAYVNNILAGEDKATTEEISDDLTQLAISRRELVNSALDTETTYARALTDLNFAVHRLANAVEHYKSFISERLLWVQSSDPLSWSLFTELPGQLAEVFHPSVILELLNWYLRFILGAPLWMMLFLIAAVLLYITPTLKRKLTDSGRNVGVVRKDSLAQTAKSLAYTLALSLRWPFLMVVLAVPLGFHESDRTLPSALFGATLQTALYYLGLEFLRTMLFREGLVSEHFRWPTQLVENLHKRVVRLEQTFLIAVFFGVLFLNMNPTNVGGSVGTLAVITMLVSIAYFFFRMPHFIQGKLDRLFTVPQIRLHSSWGSIVRALLTWTPMAMVIAVLFGYTYTAVKFSALIMQTVALFVGMLLLYELGTRWLRITRRLLRYNMQEEEAYAIDDDESSTEDESLEQDPELLDDEGTKFLNAMMLIGSFFGLIVVWSDVFPALGILNSIELWQRIDSLNGRDLVVSTTLGDLFGAIVVAILGWIIIRRFPGLLEILLRRKTSIGSGSAYAVATIVKYFLTAAIVVTVLSMLGGSWSQIQWAVAALSLGIGFGLQEIVANFFSGIIILFEQPVRVGDTVTVGDTTGVVTKIHMRATTIRDWDGRELLVPNKEFVTGRLLNWSLTDQVTRLHIELGVAYGTDMDKAMKIVKRAAVQHPLIIEDPAPFVTFEKFGDNSLNISLRCYLEELEKRLTTASAIRLEINRTLIAADICVSFPQRDVHLDTNGPLDIRLVEPPPVAG